MSGASTAGTLRAHDENFPILFRLLRRDQREDMAAIYWFCRVTDDLGDEAEGDRLAGLEAWGRQIEAAIAGATPSDPRLQALRRAVHRRRLDPDLLRRLIEGNRIDQLQRRWDTEADLLHYCEHSATPVGRMVLGVLGHADTCQAAYADATCIGLQLVNLWQDVRRDLDDRDRIYFPREHMERFGVTEADILSRVPTPAIRALTSFEVDRARAWLDCGAPLSRLVGWRARIDLAAFTIAGRAMCDQIARSGFETLAHRPAPGRIGRARILLRAVASTVRGRA